MMTPPAAPFLVGGTFATANAGVETPPKTEPVFDASSITLQRRMRFNPLRMLDPENLSTALDHFDIGILNTAARLWDAMCRRDDTLSFLKPQLEDTIASKPWGVFMKKGADPKEAARHQAALEYFYAHLRATDAFDRNVRGGRHLFIKQMMTSASFVYAVHHFVWNPQPGKMIEVEGSAPVPALTATLEFVPLQYFENTTGTLRFLPMGGYGIVGEDLNWDGEWMATTGDGIMFAASICYVFKRLTFQDWTIFNERYAQNKVVGQTNAQKDSEAGRAMENIVANFNSDQGIVLFESPPGDKPPISLIGPQGTTSVDLFQRFLDRQDGKMSVMYRGSDRANVAGEKKDNGITAQMEETERMEMAHCQRIADSCQQGIDRQVIRFCFGEGVEPLAYFGLPDMDAEDAQQVRESAGFLADRGELVDGADIAERLGITLTEDPDTALQPISNAAAAAANPDETQRRGGAEKTANARGVARLQQLVEEALRTHNSPDEPRDDHGRWVADQSAGTMTPAEAREKLQAGIDTQDALGNAVRFDGHVLEHWEAEGHDQREKDRRLRRLPDAVRAVETPHEVWQSGKQTVHLRAFEDEKSKRRVIAGFIMEGGKARTFFHFNRASEVAKLRKGTLLYARS